MLLSLGVEWNFCIQFNVWNCSIFFIWYIRKKTTTDTETNLAVLGKSQVYAGYFAPLQIYATKF
ncbi:Uncharacterised protein [uncultured archaeon]|nr:Uncharacterised protein [uncultured archaeon]